jgi:hypothetical protein
MTAASSTLKPTITTMKIKLKTKNEVHNAKEFYLDATTGAPGARVRRLAVGGMLHNEAVGGL